ncbi:hypothetical protein RRG08_045541 [Elysia crispata]|uniref:Uncharacterized protein n=1 Tax=Elysia crispata TaxID=231223 RepID=A0AAE1DGP5_9GAST|nr:hypothetical protein RRG08_045541 [Elysia crispata]
MRRLRRGLEILTLSDYDDATTTSDLTERGRCGEYTAAAAAVRGQYYYGGRCDSTDYDTTSAVQRWNEVENTYSELSAEMRLQVYDEMRGPCRACIWPDPSRNRLGLVTFTTNECVRQYVTKPRCATGMGIPDVGDDGDGSTDDSDGYDGTR